MRRLASVFVAGALAAIAPATASAVDVTWCGQIVPAGKVGRLVADLDCSDPNSLSSLRYPNAITLGKRATLALDGFSLIGPTAFGVGVDCHWHCKVNGPGTITGFTIGIHAHGRGSKVADVTVIGASQDGIHAHGRFKGRRITITGSGEAGLGGSAARYGKLVVIDSDISGNDGTGILAGKILLKNVLVTGNGDSGVYSPGGVVRAVDTEITDNNPDCPPSRSTFQCNLIGSSKKRLRRTNVGGTCFKGCPR